MSEIANGIPSMRSFFAYYRIITGNNDWQVIEIGKSIRLLYKGSDPVVAFGNKTLDIPIFCPVTAVIFHITGKFFWTFSAEKALSSIETNIEALKIIGPADCKSLDIIIGLYPNYSKKDFSKTREILKRPI